MLPTLDALQDLERAVRLGRDLIHALELILDLEPLPDDLEGGASAARARLPAAEEEEPRAIEARDDLDRLRQGGRRLVRVEKAAGRAVDRHQLEGYLLADRHHDLLQLRLGSERDEPHLRAGRLRGEVGRLVERLRSPRVEHGRQHELVLEGGAGRARDGLERLQGIRDDAAADDDVKAAHPVSFRGRLVLGRVQPARAGAEGDIALLAVERLRAVPQAGATVDALLAVEGGDLPLSRRDGLRRADLDAGARAAALADGRLKEHDVVGVAGGRLHLAA